MSKRRSPRKWWVIAGAGAAALLVVAGVIAVQNVPGVVSAGGQSEGPKSARGFIEPPLFADRVASGELPPIDERIPADPFVVGAGTLLQSDYMDWEDGRYGGTLDFAGPAATGFVNVAGGATILRSPSQSTDLSAPNIVSDLEHNDDYTVYTFTIRDGLKWSDGVPLTSEDVRFTFEDLYNDPDAKRPYPTFLYTQGNVDLGPAEFAVVDDLTFTLTFSQPYGYFVADLNSWIPSYTDIFKPAHYLEQFHAKYADSTELADAVASAGKADWVELLGYMDVSHWDVGEERALGMPTLNAWILTESSEGQRVFERNPYFWHVDASGHQLPYVDKVVNTIVVDSDAQTNAILAGQVSIASSTEASLSKMSVYKQNADRSGLRIFTTSSFNSPLTLFLNRDFGYENPDSPWQVLMSDPDHRFNEAVQAAIDTDAINKAVYFGLYQDLAPEYQGYDPDLANSLLDDLGMTKGTDGMRAGPDGQPFTLRITHPGSSADFTPVVELLKEQLGDVGVSVDIDQIDTLLFEQQKTQADSIMASITWNDANGWESGMSEDYLPASKGPWSPATWQYFASDGAEGRAPDSSMQEFYDLYTERKAYPPQSEEGKEVYEKMLTWLGDNYVFIQTSGAKTAPNIVADKLRNVPNEGSPAELDTYINAEGMWFEE